VLAPERPDLAGYLADVLRGDTTAAGLAATGTAVPA
jgi:hypothetical protein